MATDVFHSEDQFHLFSHVLPSEPRLKGKSILQVGARPGDGWLKIFQGFHDNGYNRFHILEIHEPNVDWLRQKQEPQLVVHGDIRLIDTYGDLDPAYDIVTFWHGPEHLTHLQFCETIPKVMTKVKRAFIVGAPWGKWEQEDIKGNPHERHLHHWYPEDWESLGFHVFTFNDPSKGKGPDIHNVMMGIKYATE